MKRPVFIDIIRTAQKTHSISIIKNQSMTVAEGNNR